MICIPKLALEIQDLSLPATVLLPRLDNTNYLQHPSHSRLKETIKSMMYWKSMHTPSSNVKSCRSYHKQETQPKVWSCTIKAGHNDSPKSIMCTPHEVILGGPALKLAKKKFAPNAIFKVGSCLYILYDLTSSILLKNSTHSCSYEAYRRFVVFFTSD